MKQTELRAINTALSLVIAGEWDHGSLGPRPDFEGALERVQAQIRTPRISETQAQALRLAAEVPSCLKRSNWRRTVALLERLGLVESLGTYSSGDGHSDTSLGITDLGREALAQFQRRAG